MRINYIAIITVLLSSAISLPAQDRSVANQNVPDASAYSDLLTKGKKPSPKKVEREIPDAKASEDLFGKGRQSSPRAQASLNDNEIERVLTEAQIRLEEIGKKVPVYEQAAQDVFTKTIDLFEQRLEEMRAKREREDARKKSADEKGVEGARVKAGGEQSVLAKGKPSSSKDAEVEQPVLKETLPEKAVLIYRIVEQLRALGDRIVEEADNGRSKDN